MAHPEHKRVRELYGYACGYCSITETDTGGQLTIDHYHPTSANGGNAGDNLVYACFRCNLFKGDYWSPGEERLRVLHPLRDDLSHHYQHDTVSGRLEPLTETGRFHIALLRLNRPELVAYHLRQQIAKMTKEQIRLLRTRIELLEKALADAEAYMRLIE